MSPVGASYVIEGKAKDFVILQPINPMSEFEDNYAWVDLEDGFNKAKADPTFLLDKVFSPKIIVKHSVLESETARPVSCRTALSTHLHVWDR